MYAWARFAAWSLFLSNIITFTRRIVSKGAIPVRSFASIPDRSISLRGCNVRYSDAFREDASTMFFSSRLSFAIPCFEDDPVIKSSN